VYALGATGIMNTLDARTGTVVWTRNAASDTKTEVPDYGFASSPLLAGDVVIVATAGTLVAYDVTSGDLRWVGPHGRSDYSSPQLATIHGVEQVLLLNGGGTTSVLPADGTVLWEHALPPNTRIVQPALTSDGDVLMSDGAFGEGNALRRITVARSATNWTSEERWRSTSLKPTFNDYVLHEGHAYGFDGSILACIDLADGQRKWKGGRYGNGQLVLLPDQDVLLVLSEEGELALVAAAPDGFTELGRVPAIQGKTWNHPVLVRDVLLVRNGEEMAAFRLRLTE
jgi:outer membrane protein assembly factor BamB